MKKLPSWIPAVATAAALIGLSIAEVRRPLRRTRQEKTRRFARNLTIGVISTVVTGALQIPLLAPVARRTAERRLGLLHALPLPRVARVAGGVLLLDYTLWWWHWLNHEWPPLWRFHLAHHVDLDLDASTGLRFHFGEMALSVLFRAGQFRLLGIDPLAASIWQATLLVSIVFHHSNVRLPESFERRLASWITTPRMHGIHHSGIRDETDSNWSSLLSWWDHLHGTFRLDIPQEAVTIGVPAWQDSREVTLGRVLALPFEEQRDDWADRNGVKRLTR
ncbi:MAG: sterol desaturase family protein [Thermoanaerobaculia bacterium]